MVLFTLINVSLDISTNIAWWITKNTLYGTYCIITYMIPKKITKEELELIELRNEISILNKKLLSICIPTFNRAEILNSTLFSLASILRASGRMFWPVFYFILFLASNKHISNCSSLLKLLLFNTMASSALKRGLSVLVESM